MNSEKRRNTLIVTLTGEIDHHSTEDIKITIDREFENSKAKNILFDFSMVEFMDSSGIGLLIGRYKVVSASGGQAAVAGVSGLVDRILDISGIYKIMRRYNSLDDALDVIDYGGSL